LRGRRSDVVNVAGKRASLASLNHHLLAIPGVQDGAYLVPEEKGVAVSRLTAFVVAPDLSARTVLDELRRRVDPVFLPRPLYFVARLPRDATGKLSREALLRLAAECAKR
jgi:acyl-coenzyme A synthetase/AMP-(fatty) acid ligase